MYIVSECLCVHKEHSKAGVQNKKLTIIFSTLEDVEENDDCILDVDILASICEEGKHW
jgi:hypothetical protein